MCKIEQKALRESPGNQSHIINVSYFCVTYRDLTGFVVQAPSLASEHPEAKLTCAKS